MKKELVVGVLFLALCSFISFGCGQAAVEPDTAQEDAAMTTDEGAADVEGEATAADEEQAMGDEAMGDEAMGEETTDAGDEEAAGADEGAGAQE